MPYNVTAKTASRLIVHTKSPFGNFAFEVGLAFHPILNVPYIPASCIKGAIRAYVEVNELVSDPTQIFGAAGTETGKILVTDAFPLKWNNVLLEPEVTTPIYRDSAKEHEASPTPIIYLTIARNVTFRFIVAMRDVSKEQEHAIKNWIQAALKEGLGSKTMLGYGRMEGRLP
jgi:CRISPR-associated protein Cmr6